jgi:hypothetical protein
MNIALDYEEIKFWKSERNVGAISLKEFQRYSFYEEYEGKLVFLPIGIWISNKQFGESYDQLLL